MSNKDKYKVSIFTAFSIILLHLSLYCYSYMLGLLGERVIHTQIGMYINYFGLLIVILYYLMPLIAVITGTFVYRKKFVELGLWKKIMQGASISLNASIAMFFFLILWQLMTDLHEPTFKARYLAIGEISKQLNTNPTLFYFHILVTSSLGAPVLIFLTGLMGSFLASIIIRRTK